MGAGGTSTLVVVVVGCATKVRPLRAAVLAHLSIHNQLSRINIPNNHEELKNI